jgi:hypothetical protein
MVNGTGKNNRRTVKKREKINEIRLGLLSKKFISSKIWRLKKRILAAPIYAFYSFYEPITGSNTLHTFLVHSRKKTKMKKLLVATASHIKRQLNFHHFHHLQLQLVANVARTVWRDSRIVFDIVHYMRAKLKGDRNQKIPKMKSRATNLHGPTPSSNELAIQINEFEISGQ